MSFFETCKILTLDQIVYNSMVRKVIIRSDMINKYTQHHPAAVEFNYNDIYKREDTYHDVIGFYHTHPSGLNCMSAVDTETMAQWVKCLGKRLFCLIETEENLNAWQCFNYKEVGMSKRIKIDNLNDNSYAIYMNDCSNILDGIRFQ